MKWNVWELCVSSWTAEQMANALVSLWSPFPMQDWVWWKEEKENSFAFSATEVARIWGPYTLKGKQFLGFFFFWKDQEELGWQSRKKRTGKAAETCLSFKKKAKVVILGFLWIQPSWAYGRLSRNKVGWDAAWEERAPHNTGKSAQHRVNPKKKFFRPILGHFPGPLNNAKTSRWNFEDT